MLSKLVSSEFKFEKFKALNFLLSINCLIYQIKVIEKTDYKRMFYSWLNDIVTSKRQISNFPNEDIELKIAKPM